MSIIIGVDIGGTFTDLVMHDEASGKTNVAKVPSTPDNFSIGLIEGLETLRVNIPEIDLIVHGTTVATNAVLERKGARLRFDHDQGLSGRHRASPTRSTSNLRA